MGLRVWAPIPAWLLTQITSRYKEVCKSNGWITTTIFRTCSNKCSSIATCWWCNSSSLNNRHLHPKMKLFLTIKKSLKSMTKTSLFLWFNLRNHSCQNVLMSQSFKRVWRAIMSQQQINSKKRRRRTKMWAHSKCLKNKICNNSLIMKCMILTKLRKTKGSSILADMKFKSTMRRSFKLPEEL